MIHTVENDHLILSVSEKGAEMHSVIFKKNNKELLWQVDPAVWGRRAPVLFPIVGKLKGNSFRFNDLHYSLTQHGFARDMHFELKDKSADKLVFELHSSEETLKKFPFEFRVQISYALHNNLVECRYLVSNPGSTEIFFSIGSHPGFICPLFENEKFEDYTITFEKEENCERELLSDGLQSGASEPCLDTSKTIELKQELFDKDAIVLKNLRSTSLTLGSKFYELQFNWFNMPFFGIWTKPGQSAFLCLEPWAGIADHIDATGELSEKEGIISLQTNQQYECGFSFGPDFPKAK